LVKRSLRWQITLCGILWRMKHRFLLHSLNHTVLSVDISEIGLPNSVIEFGGEKQSVSSIRFRTWSQAEEYLSKLGASSESLVKVKDDLRKNGLAVLTVT
jgi:hypothetical protein